MDDQLQSALLNFRRATNQDLFAIQNVVFPILREYSLVPEPNGTDSDLNDLESTYFKNNGYFEVCESNGTIVGTWGLFPTNNVVCELRKMYLAKSHRNLGIGKTMMDRAITKARELGYRQMELETASVLKNAIAMYQRYGFRAATRSIETPRCDQVYQLNL